MIGRRRTDALSAGVAEVARLVAAKAPGSRPRAEVRLDPGSPYRIDGAGSVGAGDWLAAVGRRLGLEVTARADAPEDDPLSELLGRRLRAAREASEAGGSEEGGPRLEGVELEAAAERAVRELAAAESEEREALRRRLEELEERSVDGIGYRMGGGGGDPILVVNAYGQGSPVWDPLLARLAGRRRLLVWGGRRDGRERTLEGHARDLETILDDAGIERCHVLAWCTGPKVALELWGRDAGRIRSLAFLTGAFRPLPGHAHLDTAYEKNLEPLLGMVAAKPQLAERLQGTLRGVLAAPRKESPGDRGILARRDPALDPLVLAPYGSAESVAVYARQLVDFWKRDVTGLLARVTAPVLAVGAELDEIASPALGRVVAERLDDGRYVEVRGATHYLHYEQPDLVAGLLDAFFTDGTGFELDHPWIVEGGIPSRETEGKPAPA